MKILLKYRKFKFLKIFICEKQFDNFYFLYLKIMNMTILNFRTKNWFEISNFMIAFTFLKSDLFHFYDSRDPYFEKESRPRTKRIKFNLLKYNILLFEEKEFSISNCIHCKKKIEKKRVDKKYNIFLFDISKKGTVTCDKCINKHAFIKNIK